ncbi:phosphotransferase [Tabrizicola sp.]|uniref:phosphotransferase n=1 Tax=Tabrizicola sp. TaxID=2005166 RepID=UPI00273534A6|nr:phosphotransferase [Tabrizicola sp.]MDP3197858.1 phosphotransferase [Tabrizicola sp.]
MTQDPAGSLLSLPPPQVPLPALAQLAATHWGVTGTLHPLTSERDQNLRLDTPQGSFTLKLANPAESADLTGFQTEALLHTARHAPDLPIPRVVPAHDGRTIVPTPDGALRLLTWLPGSPLAHLPRTPALAASIGDALGRLDATLASFQHPAADHHLLWDIRNTSDLAPLTAALPDDLKPRITAFLTRFATRTAPVLAQLPRQVVHGDFNPHNLLADPTLPSDLAGILDFGDMTLSHRVCDLAVAASYLIDPSDPSALLAPLTRAYHQANPLTDTELRLLPDLITARLATTLTISAWRAARYPENAPYILRNAPTSRAGLDALGDPDALADHLLHACESPPQ